MNSKIYLRQASLCLLLMVAGLLSAMAQQPAKDLNIVFIGNSITKGAGLQDAASEAPPVQAVNWLRTQPGVGKVAFSNQGVSGFTTVDFLPSANMQFRKVEMAADQYKTVKDALLVFSIKLGTNDSAIEGPNGAPVSAESYRANLKAIADKLLVDYPGSRIILQYPIWYSSNTYNGSRYLQEGLDRLQSYFPEITALVQSYATTHPGRLYAGDQDGFVYFREHYQTDFQHENGKKGVFYLHPNKRGAEVLGQFWGKAIYKAVM